MRSYQDSARWWGGHGRGDNRPSLLDLVRNNTLDIGLASILWLLVEKKASIIAAAGPRLAGKTALLTALIDFMPPWYEKVPTRGRDEDFSLLEATDPSNTYILVPELSDHTPAYLWGDAVGVLFRALERGYSMAATMHADTAEEVTTMLGVHVPLALVHHVDVVVNLRLLSGAGGMMRRVDQVSLVTPGPRHTSVAQWDAHSDTFALAGPDDTLNALAAHAGMGPGDTEDDLARRAERLRSWLELGHLSAVEVEQMVARHYEPSG